MRLLDTKQTWISLNRAICLVISLSMNRKVAVPWANGNPNGWPWPNSYLRWSDSDSNFNSEKRSFPFKWNAWKCYRLLILSFNYWVNSQRIKHYSTLACHFVDDIEWLDFNRHSLAIWFSLDLGHKMNQSISFTRCLPIGLEFWVEIPTTKLSQSVAFCQKFKFALI